MNSLDLQSAPTRATGISRGARRKPLKLRRATAIGAPRPAHQPTVWAIRIGHLIMLVGAWQWYGTVSGGIFVPSVTDTFAEFPKLIATGQLTDALIQSNIALLIGYPLSVIFGLALGFIIGRNRVADRALSYWLDIAMVIPMVAVIPVVIVALGLSLSARVAVVVLFTLPVIALNARAAVRVIQPDLVEMAASFGASRRQTWMEVILPSAIPVIFTGLSIGIGRAISGMIIVELVLIPAGLGGLLLDFKSTFSAAALYAVTLVVAAEGIILTSLGRMVEKRIQRRMQGGVTNEAS
ncbi:ABC transporter permease [Microbacterium sp. YY-01]|uniref:ABC transporter permease n=1 Tax=Microbacterium sp. YY-01 TaxID=3421634 RepID=UPI003D173A12